MISGGREIPLIDMIILARCEAVSVIALNIEILSMLHGGCTDLHRPRTLLEDYVDGLINN